MFARFQNRTVSDQVVLVMAGVVAFSIVGMMSVICWDIISDTKHTGIERIFVWASRLINSIIGFIFGYITAGSISSRDRDNAKDREDDSK